MSDGVFTETKIPIDKIIPNPNNPRKHFDEGKLGELALSIMEVGILQPLVITQGTEEGKYLLIAGERRLRAAQIAGKTHVPVIYRSSGDLQGEEMQQAYMLIENLQREDLDPIEEAKAFATLTRDHGWKQTDLAEKLGVSQAHIANRIRLLQLPEIVQESISDGIITASTGKELATYSKIPAVSKSLEKAVKDKAHPDNLLWMAKNQAYENTRPLHKKSYPEPKFILKPCEQCNERIVLPDHHAQSTGDKKLPRCLNVKCWEDKQKQAEEEAREKARQQVLSTGKDIVDLNNLPYDSYESLESHNRKFDLVECQECEHNRHGRYNHMDEEEAKQVCLNPACFKAKRAVVEKEERRREKEVKAAYEKLKEEMIAEFDPRTLSEFRPLVYIAAQAIQNPPHSFTLTKSKLETAVYERYGWEKSKAMQDIASSWAEEAKHLVNQLATLTAEELLRLIFFVMLKPVERDNRVFEAVYGANAEMESGVVPDA